MKKKRGIAVLCFLCLLASCNIFVDDTQDPGSENPPLEVPNNSIGKNLFVSPSGDDSLTYEENDQEHPWLTPEIAWQNAQAGDVVYFRQGTYTVSSTITTRLRGNDGTVDAPILFTNYPGEEPLILGDCGGSSILEIDRNYHQIEGLTIRGGNLGDEAAIIMVGWTREAQHFAIRNCLVEATSSHSMNNVAVIRLQASRANYAEISHCELVGDGIVNGTIVFRATGFQFFNNEVQGCGTGIYMKHSNALDSSEENIPRVYNNYFHGIEGSGIYGVFNYALIKNNLLDSCSLYLGDDGGLGDGYVGADYNRILNNTIYYGNITLRYDSRTPDEEPNRGCLHNVIENNIISDFCHWHLYDRPRDALGNVITDYDYDIQSDYNLYCADASVIGEERISYSLADWRNHNGSDTHSLAGAPVFIGGAAPQQIEDFALADGSPGMGAASDGSDMGVDVSLVGIDAKN